VLIVGRYIQVFESTRKTVQELLSSPKDWSRELKILSCFMTAFNECNHKITDMFFENHQSFVDQGVVTKEMIEQISIPYSSEISAEAKEKFT
jgi:hypothetical protein